jgi:hypothetical protein
MALRTDTPSRSAIWRLGSPLAGGDGGQGRCAAPSQDLASRWARVVEAWVRRGEGPVNLGGQWGEPVSHRAGTETHCGAQRDPPPRVDVVMRLTGLMRAHPIVETAILSGKASPAVLTTQYRR